MFQASVPVTADAFFNRTAEVSQLKNAIEKLQAGAPTWVCLIGPRKVGKTSLILELARHLASPSLHFVVLDVFERAPVSLEIFRTYAVRVADVALGSDIGASLETLAGRPDEYRKALVGSTRFTTLPADVRLTLTEVVDRPMDERLLRAIVELPERIAQALKVFVFVAIDEFQELGGKLFGATRLDLMPFLRSVWQRHKRVGYAISGSAQSMLLALVTREHSPFFQHFSISRIGPFEREFAIRFLVEYAPSTHPIPVSVATRAVDIFGGQPFYLQLLGEALTTNLAPCDDQLLKESIQNLLFSRTGRLSLYFEKEYERTVGNSAFLAAALDALADAPLRLGEIASKIQTPAGATARYIERLADVVLQEDKLYKLADPVFALWLRWRKPGGTVVPMRALGDEAEKVSAEALARTGFELTYQSRGSRGAFDLIAFRGIHRLGVQVKRTNLPVRFSSAEWTRMTADGPQLCSAWLVMAVSKQHEVLALDPKKAEKTSRGVVLGAQAIIPNLLLWLEEGRAAALKKEGPRVAAATAQVATKRKRRGM